MTIFQQSYNSTALTVINQVKEAINNLYDPSDDNITTSTKRSRHAEVDQGPTNYQTWHFKAMTDYADWQKIPVKKKTKRDPADPNENMAKPENVEYYRSNQQHTPTTVVHERWDQEVKEKGVFTTRGDGSRFQCELPPDGVSKGTWPFCLLPCLHCFFSPVPYICIPFVGH